LSLEEIRNVELEKIDEQAKKIDQKESGTSDENEMMLFHGTKDKRIHRSPRHSVSI
jgi:hypothetical protein